MFKSLAALAPLMLLASPLAAQMADHAMEEKPMADHAMGATPMADHAMAPMSAADKRLMAKCAKMKPARAAKAPGCAKMMKTHPAMDHAM